MAYIEAEDAQKLLVPENIKAMNVGAEGIEVDLHNGGNIEIETGLDDTLQYFYWKPDNS